MSKSTIDKRAALRYEFTKEMVPKVNAYGSWLEDQLIAAREEIDALKHDLSRSMANHAADINANHQD